jgi:hypothetical protein
MADSGPTPTSQTEPSIGTATVQLGAAVGASWTPVLGTETTTLLESVLDSDDSRRRVREEATRLLSSGVPPGSAEESITELAVGNVQSGKTLNFTTAASLARDNNFAVVILIAGVSVPLLNQSKDRLYADLRLNTRSDRSWRPFVNPRGHDAAAIRATLADWRDSQVPPHLRQTLLVTVMKHHRHLRNLSRIFSDCNLGGLSILVVDDEADQAGMNAGASRGTQSPTYRELLALRRSLPPHTYLQYTATPQAPLLINLIDLLSPRYGDVLTPGPDYVGGEDFFKLRPELVRLIPSGEIPSQANVLHAPPATLLEALRLFFVGVASGLNEQQPTRNRSMLVHPSQQTLRHAEYSHWIRTTQASWEALLARPSTDGDRVDLVEEFKTAYDDLTHTATGLAPFAKVVETLSYAIRRTLVTEVNAVGGRTPSIDWRGTYSHVLVGGQAMDRGFTVEGLTVTYMPRGVGVGNADTVQQRARFFGYKRPYLGLCRVFLEVAVRDAYRKYVDHEEDIRKRLIAHRRTGRPLTEFKRAFFLDSSLRPTRSAVLDLDYMQGKMSAEWFRHNAPHASTEAASANRTLAEAVIAPMALSPDPTDHHLVSGLVNLADLYTNLLTLWRVTRQAESQRYTGLLLQVAAFLEENPDAKAKVYVMNKKISRERTLDGDVVNNLFQGPSPADGSQYPGDQLMRDSSVLSVQLHFLNLKRSHAIIGENIPAIAVWVPASMSRGWLVQAQG